MKKIKINRKKDLKIKVINIQIFASDGKKCNPDCDPNCNPTCVPRCSPSCSPCFPFHNCNPRLFG